MFADVFVVAIFVFVFYVMVVVVVGVVFVFVFVGRCVVAVFFEEKLVWFVWLVSLEFGAGFDVFVGFVFFVGRLVWFVWLGLGVFVERVPHRRSEGFAHYVTDIHVVPRVTRRIASHVVRKSGGVVCVGRCVK